MINPFSIKSRIEFQKEEHKVKAQLRELSVLAGDLLRDNRYQKFAKIVEDAEKNTLDLLFRYKESDPYKFKAKIDEFLIELRVY